MEELEKKVINDPVKKHPVEVNRDFVRYFTKMLNKDPAKRPSIEQIIFDDMFQKKAQEFRVTLPLLMNKKKLEQYASTAKL